MIFDRTQKDVDDALVIRDEKVKNFVELTADDLSTLERGFLTINTLNRIENKTAELWESIREIYYYTEPLSTRTWDYTDFFQESDFERIIHNLEKLKKAFLLYHDTPLMPMFNYRRFEVINDAEKILFDIDRMIEEIKSLWRECGTFQCGEE